MDSQAQLQRTHGQHQAEEPIRIHHPEEEGRHEKGPAKVLKKVKEKAKKIKKALTKHGHGHEHDRGEHIPDDHDLDEKDDEDDYEDQELHGGAAGRGKAHIKDPVKEEIVPPDTKAFPVVSSSHTKPSEPIRGVEPVRGSKSNASHGHEALSHPAAPGGGSGALGGMSNYHSKVTDPTGKSGGEIGAAPTIAALGRKQKTGEHDQLGLGRDMPDKSHGFDLKSGPKMGKQLPAANYGSGLGKEFPARSHEFDGGRENRVEGEQTPSSGSGYGNKVAGMVTPVYEKVKETGASVMTKLPFSGGGTGTETETQQGQDKGVSAREYLTEKLSPGEEDKALSEVIAENLHLGGGGGENTTAPAKKGKVTQSEEVEKRLGGFSDPRSEGEMKHGEAFAEEGEGGMLEKLRGAVTSWASGTTEEVMQKSTESVQDSSQSVGATVGNMGFSGSGADGAGQRSGGKSGSVPVQKGFQESGN